MSIEIKVKQGKTLTEQEKMSLVMLNAMLERRGKLIREKRAQQQATQQQEQAQAQAQPQPPPPSPEA